MEGGIGGTWRFAAVLAAGFLAAGCAPRVSARWDGTGERYEARYFQIVLDARERTPTAAWLDRGGADARLAVCGFREEDGVVEFRLDPDTPALSCDDLRKPLRFVGSFGRDVLAGTVEDDQGRAVGRFRAFRARD